VSAQIYMDSRVYYAVRVEYFEYDGTASVSLA
jgi:hypothetical protein